MKTSEQLLLKKPKEFLEKDVSLGRAVEVLTNGDMSIIDSGKKFFDKLKSMIK